MGTGTPRSPVTVPAAVQRVAAGAVTRVVWRNKVGGLTFELTDPASAFSPHRFVKWEPTGNPVDLSGEAERLWWAAPFAPVPMVLDLGSDEHGSWLVTSALNGVNAVDPRWRKEPRAAVSAVGEGLRALHEALPVGSCPFSRTTDERVAALRRRAAIERSGGENRGPAGHRRMSIEAALDRLEKPPAIDVVVCHGDSCAPNTLLGEDGRWSGHVDLGLLGVGDRWADLAVATWSIERNYGPGRVSLLFEAYGICADLERVRYYQFLSDAEAQLGGAADIGP